MANISFLAPPVAFIVILASVLLVSGALSRLSYRSKQQAKGAAEPYACGEKIPTHMIQPDYAQFLPFALFFTILHVVALMIATVPVETAATLVFAVVYVIGALVGLSVLHRR
jgi:NADH-quinone oxidoreductase subunit A